MRKIISYRKLLQGLLIALAYGYLVYKLVTFDNYAACVDYFAQVSWQKVLLFVVALLLFPLNVFFESLKWRALLQNILPDMSIYEAIRQTYNGFVGAFFTPARLGDYPSRTLLIQEKEKCVPAIMMGFVGSMIMTLVIVLAGICATLVLYLRAENVPIPFISLNDSKWFIIAILLLVVGLLLLLFLPALSRWAANRVGLRYKRLYSTLQSMGKLTPTRIMQLVALSTARYIVFAAQMTLLLLFCGIGWETLFQLMLWVAVYYLLVTISPTLPVADVAIKGSWAIIVFSSLDSNVANITLATILIWITNTILPMLVGTFASYKKKL